MTILLSYINQIAMFFALLPDEEYIYYLLIMIMAVISYVIFHPLIVWLITLKTTKLLTYFMSSLIVLLFLCAMLIVLGESRLTLFEFVKMGLQSLAMFGLFIIIYNLFVATFKKFGFKK